MLSKFALLVSSGSQSPAFDVERRAARGSRARTRGGSGAGTCAARDWALRARRCRACVSSAVMSAACVAASGRCAPRRRHHARLQLDDHLLRDLGMLGRLRHVERRQRQPGRRTTFVVAGRAVLRDDRVVFGNVGGRRRAGAHRRDRRPRSRGAAVCVAGVAAAGRAGAALGVPPCAANGDRSASTALAANPRHKTPVPSTAFVPLLIHSPD